MVAAGSLEKMSATIKSSSLCFCAVISASTLEREGRNCRSLSKLALNLRTRCPSPHTLEGRSETALTISQETSSTALRATHVRWRVIAFWSIVGNINVQVEVELMFEFFLDDMAAYLAIRNRASPAMFVPLARWQRDKHCRIVFALVIQRIIDHYWSSQS